MSNYFNQIMKLDSRLRQHTSSTVNQISGNVEQSDVDISEKDQHLQITGAFSISSKDKIDKPEDDTAEVVSPKTLNNDTVNQDTGFSDDIEIDIDEDEEDKEEIEQDDYEKIEIQLRSNINSTKISNSKEIEADLNPAPSIENNIIDFSDNNANNCQDIPDVPNHSPISPSVEKVSDVENISDLQPALEEPKSPENSISTIDQKFDVLQPPILRAWSCMPQFCIFCPASFKDDTAFQIHIVKCNSVLTQLADFKKKKCLVCNRRITHFNVTGLLRHSISCIILEREKREIEKKNVRNDEKPVADLPSTSTADAQSNLSCRLRSSSNAMSIEGLKGLPTKRKHFSVEQIQILDSSFQNKNYPTQSEIGGLSEQTLLSVIQIDTWFRTKRFLVKNRKRKRSGSQRSQRTLARQKQKPEETPKGKRGERFSKTITQTLSKSFEIRKYPSYDEVKLLARKTKLNEKQIRDWFNNVRKKVRSSHACVKSKQFSENSVKDEQEIKMETASNEEESETDESDDTNQRYLSLTNMSHKLQKSLEKSYQANSNPKVTDFLLLSQQNNISHQSIVDWFTKRRKRENDEDFLVIPKQEKIRRTSCESTSYEDKSNTVEVKYRSNRQKLLALKKVTGQHIQDVLNENRPAITELLLLYCGADRSTQQILENECVNLANSLETNNPYSVTLITHFGNWEDDFVTGMYPERNDVKDWINMVDNFRVKLLQVWSRVLIYANVIGVQLETAALEIYQLAKTRNDHNDSVTWVMPNLLHQVRATSASKSPQFESDSDDSSEDLFEEV